MNMREGEIVFFFFSSRRRHTRSKRDWSSDVCSSDLVDIMVDSVPPSLPHIRAGKVRALAVTSARRVPQLPEVPTMIESGYPDFEINGWSGVVTTAGTPGGVIARLESEIRRALSQPQVVAAYENAGLTV